MNLAHSLIGVATNIGWSLLHFVWQGALIYLGYRLAAASLLRRASPRARYTTGVVALLLMAVAPIATYLNLAASASIASAADAARGVTQLGASVITAGSSDMGARLGQWLEPVLPWIVGLWFVGVTIHALRLFSGWRYVNALRQAAESDLPRELFERFDMLRKRIGISRPVALARSTLVSAPMVIGWLRPVILMPPAAIAGLTPYQMELILAHELAHVRRHDYLVNLFQLVLETVLFYHPMVGWLSARVRHERESCCDELVVRSGADAVCYAQALTELELLRSDGVSFAVGATDGILLVRVQRILAPPAPSPLLAIWLTGALVLGAAVAGVTGMHDISLHLGATSTDLPTMVRQELAAAGKSVKPRAAIMADTAPEASAHQTSSPLPASTPAPRNKTRAIQTQNKPDARPHGASAPAVQGAKSERIEPKPKPATSAAIDKRQPAVAKTLAGDHPPATTTPARIAANMAVTGESKVTPTLVGANRASPTPTYSGGTPIDTPKPSYPGFELVRGREGRAILSFVVNKHGHVKDVHIVSSEPSSSFGIAARRAIHRWHFEPFRENGVAVARPVTQQFDFKLPKDADGIGCRTGSHICTNRSLVN